MSPGYWIIIWIRRAGGQLIENDDRNNWENPYQQTKGLCYLALEYQSHFKMYLWGYKYTLCVFVYFCLLAYLHLCVCQFPYLDGFVPPLREEARSYTCKLSNLRRTFVSDKQEKMMPGNKGNDDMVRRRSRTRRRRMLTTVLVMMMATTIASWWERSLPVWIWCWFWLQNLRWGATLLHTHSWVHGFQPLKRPEAKIIHRRVQKKPRRSSTASDYLHVQDSPGKATLSLVIHHVRQSSKAS